MLLVNLKKTASALNKQNDNLKLSSDSSDSDSDEPELSPIKKKASKKMPKIREPKKVQNQNLFYSNKIFFIFFYNAYFLNQMNNIQLHQTHPEKDLIYNQILFQSHCNLNKIRLNDLNPYSNCSTSHTIKFHSSAMQKEVTS